LGGGRGKRGEGKGRLCHNDILRIISVLLPKKAKKRGREREGGRQSPLLSFFLVFYIRGRQREKRKKEKKERQRPGALAPWRLSRSFNVFGGHCKGGRRKKRRKRRNQFQTQFLQSKKEKRDAGGRKRRGGGGKGRRGGKIRYFRGAYFYKYSNPPPITVALPTMKEKTERGRKKKKGKRGRQENSPNFLLYVHSKGTGWRGGAHFGSNIAVHLRVRIYRRQSQRKERERTNNPPSQLSLSPETP